MYIIMTQSRKSGYRKVILAIVLAVCSLTAAKGQSKFHFDIDYHYNLGLCEKMLGRTLKRSQYKMGGNSIQFTPRYDITQRWSAGIGIGLSIYSNLDHNTMPVFATTRYKAFKTIPDMYLFTDLGYALKVGDYTKGFTGNIGVGYTHMFKKHFGLNFQIAYNLKRFNDVPTYIYDVDKQETRFTYENSTRHSLSFGVGITL